MMKLILILLLALVCAAVLFSAAVCAVSLRTAHDAVPLSAVRRPVRLVCFSDLHGRQFGRDNARLIETIRRQSPDAIVAVGDLVDRHASAGDVERMLKLLRQLVEIAPLYFTPGNHERDYLKRDAALLERIAATGAVILDGRWLDLTLAGQPLRLGGVLGRGLYRGRSVREYESSEECCFLRDFEKTDLPTICLTHRPDTFIFGRDSYRWDVDLAISGHTHGGVIRLPLLGGLYAPAQGLFPAYDRGLYRLNGPEQLLILGGMSGHGPIPRVWNRPEVTVLDLQPRP